MEFKFKDIFIGELIQKRVKEVNMPLERICKFLKITDQDLFTVYSKKEINTELLLKFSKLLEYDFFRIYSQHIVLYAPPANVEYKSKTDNKNLTGLPSFNKNLYTVELIEFIVELVETGEKKPGEIIADYRIPKTTLYKWLKKHQKK